MFLVPIIIKIEKRASLCKKLYISENTLNRYRKNGIKMIIRIFEEYGF